MKRAKWNSEQNKVHPLQLEACQKCYFRVQGAQIMQMSWGHSGLFLHFATVCDVYEPCLSPGISALHTGHFQLPLRSYWRGMWPQRSFLPTLLKALFEPLKCSMREFPRQRKGPQEVYRRGGDRKRKGWVLRGLLIFLSPRARTVLRR